MFFAGPFDGTQGHNGYVEFPEAFDGVIGYANHYLATGSVDNPWLFGDIGLVKIIAGAKFWTRYDCCTGENLVIVSAVVMLFYNLYYTCISVTHRCSQAALACRTKIMFNMALWDTSQFGMTTLNTQEWATPRTKCKTIWNTIKQHQLCPQGFKLKLNRLNSIHEFVGAVTFY